MKAFLVVSPLSYFAILVTSAPSMTTFSTRDIDPGLFGTPAVTPAPAFDLAPGVHPRIVFNAAEYDALTSRYANSYLLPNSWARHQFRSTDFISVRSSFVSRVAVLDTSAYRGDVEDLTSWNASKRASLKGLADAMANKLDGDSHSFFLCKFWADVNEKLPDTDKFLNGEVQSMCKNAAVNWARILLAHRAFTCASACATVEHQTLSQIWDYSRRFSVSDDSTSLGLTLGLYYDIAYGELNSTERKVINSAIAMLVLKKTSWGSTPDSTIESPNGAIHPHRIFSNWAPYHSNLYLLNLAIEHESDFDVYASSVLQAESETGFNDGLNFRFSRMLVAYMDHSVYPDGSTFEDGYTYFVALREGSLGLVACTRHFSDLLGTPRFRKFIHNLVQMTEPWRCGELIGHGSGGGLGYSTYVALFQYVYPNSPLARMIWRARMGINYEEKECRIDWYQHATQITIMAREHDLSVTSATSPETLTTSQKSKMPVSVYTPRRGLIMMRDNWAENATYIHFDARPDAFIVGHDNADRGVFTFTSLRQTWLVDHQQWNLFIDSRKHSIMHVDGLAQGDFRTPGAGVIKAEDDGTVAIAGANLTYAYNTHWYQGPQEEIPRRSIISYTADGVETRSSVSFPYKESGHPHDFGWPLNDNAADIGMTDSAFRMWGYPDFGFSGMYIWKRPYRNVPLKHCARSVALIRHSGNQGYMLIADSFESTDGSPHTFESYLMLHDNVKVVTQSSRCFNGRCLIALQTLDSSKNAEMHFVSRDNIPLSYRVETFTVSRINHVRIIIKAVTNERFELWAAVHAFVSSENPSFSLNGITYNNVAEVSYRGNTKYFTLEKSMYMMKETTKPPPTFSPSPTANPSPSPSNGKMYTLSDKFIDATLFGPPAVTPAPHADFRSGVHPRVLFNWDEWDAIAIRYAATYNTANSWSSHQGKQTLSQGPNSVFVNNMATLDLSAYKGDISDLSSWSTSQLSVLGTLADKIVTAGGIEQQSLFMCAFWAAVNEKMSSSNKFLPIDTREKCIKAAFSWATVLLAHRAYNCAGTCNRGSGASRAYIWDMTRRYTGSDDGHSLGLTTALAFDVLYHDMTDGQRKRMRSALSLLVLKKESWGSSKVSSPSSPNGAIHQHRIFSYQGPLHSSLYLTNLAIEGEFDFDVYTKAVLNAEGESGFNLGLNTRFQGMLVAYTSHSIYPDGSTFEDGTTYFTAMLQGSFGFLAATRRGSNIMDSARFRNFAHQAAQMTEPWPCGALIGHSGGGGISYPTYIAMFRYAYPKGKLPAMMWRNRMGPRFENNNPCRIDWFQHSMQITILGGEHDDTVTTAASIQEFSSADQTKLSLSMYNPRRGLVIIRGSWDIDAPYVHFDARPDSFNSHVDNADRGVFTFSWGGQTWLADFPYYQNVDSRKHSLMHVDGLAQGEKRAPGVKMLKTDDNGAVAIVAANLTDAYNGHWYNVPYSNPPRVSIISYTADGMETKQTVTFENKETRDPRSFGWPNGDTGADIGMTRPEFGPFGDEDFGYSGLFLWKRNYRQTFLKHAVRSLAFVRSGTKKGYMLVADSFESVDYETHVFESYLMLDDEVNLDESASWCGGAVCLFTLNSKDNTKQVDILFTLRGGSSLVYRAESFISDKTHSRIVVKSEASGRFELWIAVNGHAKNEPSGFQMTGIRDSPVAKITYQTQQKWFMLDNNTGVMKETTASG